MDLLQETDDNTAGLDRLRSAYRSFGHVVAAFVLCVGLFAGCVPKPDTAIPRYLTEGGSGVEVSVSEFLERETRDVPGGDLLPVTACARQQSGTRQLMAALGETSGPPSVLIEGAAESARRAVGDFVDDSVVRAAIAAQVYALQRALSPDSQRSSAIEPMSPSPVESTTVSDGANDRLSLADFRDFANKMANAAHEARTAPGIAAATNASADEPPLAPTLGDFLSADRSGPLVAIGQGAAQDVNELKRRDVIAFYLKEYYRGRFTSRFGYVLGKPEIKSGIGNPTIAAFTTAFMEAVMDLALQEIAAIHVYADQALPLQEIDGEVTPVPTKYYPAGTAEGRPTATLLRTADDPKDAENDTLRTRYYFSTLKVADPGGDRNCGVTAAETRATQFLANYFADRFIMWSGGFLELLSTVDVGFVVAGGFAVGDNETLTTVAKSALEVMSRRAAETFLYNYFDRRPDRGYYDDLLRVFQAE